MSPSKITTTLLTASSPLALIHDSLPITDGHHTIPTNSVSTKDHTMIASITSTISNWFTPSRLSTLTQINLLVLALDCKPSKHKSNMPCPTTRTFPPTAVHHSLLQHSDVWSSTSGGICTQEPLFSTPSASPVWKEIQIHLEPYDLDTPWNIGWSIILSLLIESLRSLPSFCAKRTTVLNRRVIRTCFNGVLSERNCSPTNAQTWGCVCLMECVHEVECVWEFRFPNGSVFDGVCGGSAWVKLIYCGLVLLAECWGGEWC